MNRTLTFGKYKGKTLRDVFREDEKYFNWLVANEKVQPILCMDDALPFGKYKGRILSEVLTEDEGYGGFLYSKVTSYQIMNVNSDWIDVQSREDKVPTDGVYVLACRGDMHLYYSIFLLKAGDTFWDCDGLWEDCLAFHRVPDCSGDDLQLWCPKEKFPQEKQNDYKMGVGVDLKPDGTIENMMLYDFAPFRGSWIDFDEELPHSAFHSFYMYTETMHGMHWDNISDDGAKRTGNYATWIDGE